MAAPSLEQEALYGPLSSLLTASHQLQTPGLALFRHRSRASGEHVHLLYVGQTRLLLPPPRLILLDRMLDPCCIGCQAAGARHWDIRADWKGV